MNLADYILIVLIGAALAGAIRSFRKRQASGTGCCGCSGCTGCPGETCRTCDLKEEKEEKGNSSAFD